MMYLQGGSACDENKQDINTKRCKQFYESPAKKLWCHIKKSI